MMNNVDTELAQLNISKQLRSHSAFMKVMAALFHYGNQALNAAQLVVAVRALDLLTLRGETPKSTIQGIISSSRKVARDHKQPDPFHIVKGGAGRQAKYSISDAILNGIAAPPIQQIPDEPIVINAVQHPTSSASAYQLGKRQHQLMKYYTVEALRKARRRRVRARKLKQTQNTDLGGWDSSSSGSDGEVDVDSDGSTMSLDEAEETAALADLDTIRSYSLLFAPPTKDKKYIDRINFDAYPIASYFAIAQQKGYCYPRFRSQDKIKIPKIHCEDKFRVADITAASGDKVVARLFILADGHGGRGCSEYFVRHMPNAIQELCRQYDPQTLDDKAVQQRFEKDIKQAVHTMDEAYLAMKKTQLERGNDQSHHVSLPNTDENGVLAEHANRVMGEDEADKANKDKGFAPMATDAEARSDNPVSNGTSQNPNPSPIHKKTRRQELANDGCTLVMNLFFGHWLVNINVGDSRTVLISAPEHPTSTPSDHDAYNFICGQDSDYKMDVVFASQDHKPWLEHLAREILANGGEFVDSVQDRVIKMDVDKLNDDSNRQAKRGALKHARIRPKHVPAGAQGTRTNDERVPSLNVARSCGDLDFKMDPQRKIISCEPDVTFFKIANDDQDTPTRTVRDSSLYKARRRHFLFMSTDGMFDYMYEETPERQNRALAKVLGMLIEEGEKNGRAECKEQTALEGGHTITHTTTPKTQHANASTSGEARSRTTPPLSVPAPITATHPVDAQKNTPQSLLFRELSQEASEERRIRERTLVATTRYFTNREGANGFFSSTLQDYDDCTIMLIEI